MKLKMEIEIEIFHYLTLNKVRWTKNYRGPQGVLQGVLHEVKSFQMDSGRGNIGQEWSRVVLAEGYLSLTKM